MLTSPEKASLLKLYYQNKETVTAALRYSHCKGLQVGKCPTRNVAMKKITMFEAMGCLDNHRTKIVELISYGWTGISSHVGIPRNDRADQKVKQGVESSQPSEERRTL
ncbi:hypothetical protein TNCV_3080971 [Trichonephila clavipes]|nr:hypothetical protein TNCV_3080971 [Trichonephila clavipes]